MALAERQFRLDGHSFGRGLPVEVSEVEFGRPEIEDQDARNPFRDGLRFGRDYRAGRTITFELFAHSRGGADPLESVALLERAWLADAVRSRSGAFSVLTYRINGRDRRVYGRPRRFATDSRLYRSGVIGITCDFQCLDHLFYADEPVTVSTGLFAKSQTGFTFPWTFPLSESGTATASPGVLNVPGSVPTRLIEVTFHGPATNPGVEIVGGAELFIRRSLAPGESVTVRTHPSMRAALLNGSGDLSRVVAGDVDEFALAPGAANVRFVADNVTGTAQMEFQAWPAFASF